MKKIDIKLYVMACMLLVSSLSFGQMKFTDYPSVGQTLVQDNATGVSTFDLTFNTDKSLSSIVLNADSAAVGKDYYDISISKCRNYKGFGVDVYDENGAAIVNDDFKCRLSRFENSQENPVHVASIDSLVSILDAFAVNDATTSTSKQKPAHCLFDINKTAYDFRDGTIIADGQSADGKLVLSGSYNLHTGSAPNTYGVDLKLGAQIRIQVDGDCTVSFLGSQYSSLSMTAAVETGVGTITPDSLSTIVVNDLQDTYSFTYTGGPATLVFTTVADGDQDSDVYLPYVEVVPVGSDNQAFGAWPGKYKKVDYGFAVKFDANSVDTDITFTIDTYDEGNTGMTASYELTVYIGGKDAANLVATVPDFYVTGSGVKNVSLAADAGLNVSDFSDQKVYWYLKTEGTGSAIADDSFDPVIVFDDLHIVYNSAAWIKPAAGIQANAFMHDALRGDAGVEDTFVVQIQTKNRMAALTIVNDLYLNGDGDERPYVMLATGALKANDGSGNYTVDVAYTLEPSIFDSGSGKWSDAKITVAAPASGVVDDDMMFYFKATPAAGEAQISRFEMDNGTRIFYDVSIADQSAPIKMHSYTFDDGSADDMIGSVDGVLNGDKISIADGMCTVSGSTSSTSGYVSFDGAALALKDYYAVTLEAKVKAASAANGGYTMISYFGSNTAGQNCFWIQPTRGGATQSRVEANDAGTAATALKDGIEIDDGNVHHVVAVLTMDSVKYYLDGEKLAAVATGRNIVPAIGTDFACLFKGVWNDNNYNGSIDEFNIYDGELSAEVIKANSDAYKDALDASLADLSSDVGTLLPVFNTGVTSYVLSVPQGTTTVNLSATPTIAEATVNGVGEITIEGDVDTTVVSVTSSNGNNTLDYTIYVMVDQGECYTPLYSHLENLFPDPECTTSAAWNGWGNRDVYYGPEAYCGVSCALLQAPGAGCEAALDVANFTFKPNTKYRLHVMIKTIGGSIGFLANGSDPNFGFSVDTHGEWQLVDTTFTTGPNAGTNFFSFNTCDYGSNCTACYIDNYEFYEAPVMVAYVTEDKEMAATATQPDNDPIIQMLKNDPNLGVDVMTVSASAVIDLSQYDVVIAQEPFSSSAAIWKPGGSLGLENIPVPFIYNKIYALRNGKAVTMSPDAVAVGPDNKNNENVINYYLGVSSENQSNPLFSGITFDGDSVRMFDRGAYDDGAAFRDTGDEYFKAMQYLTGLAITGEDGQPNDTTLLAVMKGASGDVSVCVNDIPAGTVLGTEDTLQARMIAISQNFGAISYDMGNNMTNANLTMWRNAVYMLAGLDVPTEPVDNSIEVELDVASAVIKGDDGDAYQFTVPSGTSEVDLGVNLINGKDAVIPAISGLSDGQNAEYELKVFAPVGTDSMIYKIYVHVQSESEILYCSASNGVYATAKAYDTNVYDALVEGGYSVTFAKKGSIFEWTADGINAFDYTPYAGMVISGGESSSNVNDYAKRNYPIPCVSMQNDGPKNNKWGWVNDKKAEEFAKFSDFTVETAQMKILDNTHPITAGYTVDQLIKWSAGTPDSSDWPKEVKSYNLSDSVPGAIPLATFNEATLYPTMWAVPMGSDVRSMNGDYDTYEHVTTTSNVVLLYAFNDGLLYMTDDFKPLLLNSLDWVMNYTTPIVMEGVYYTITQKNSGLVIGADTDPVTQPAVMTASGSDDQAFMFVPVSGKLNTYYLQNKEGMYLNKEGSNNWTTVLSETTNGLLSEWILNGTDLSSVTFQLVDNLENIGVAKSYLSTDDVTSGSNLYCDKPVQAVGSNGEFMLEPLSQVKKVAYVQKSGKTVVATAADPYNDPIVEMLNADDNFEVTVIQLGA
ncbi:LamG-like jellyroll fold domain-containing protein, partial [Saccharicrinis sp. FJH2]|uniref:LamG-like jellyroll fold domain-containing protein n=1 Tax=Saccharicrinis sp. FJH65 TaxID=3344659 RepID=UPI0035F26CF7